MVFIIVFFILLVELSKVQGDASISSNAEKILIKNLTQMYAEEGVLGRPVRDKNTTMTLYFGLSLIQILSVDVLNQRLTTNAWCKYKWKDELLTWNPDDYGGVKKIRIPIEQIWKPDFTLFNYADDRLVEQRSTLALIDYTGSVVYIPTAILKSHCQIDIRNFPFDEQTCTLEFGSRSYSKDLLEPEFYHVNHTLDLSEFIPSQEWSLVEHLGFKHDYFLQFPTVHMSFHLKIRRRSVFYAYMLILPCLLLSLLTMTIFMMPPETPAKALLGINIYIEYFMLLLLLCESTPPSSPNVPLIGAYYCFNMIINTLSTFGAAIILDLHFLGIHRNLPGPWLTKVLVKVVGRSMFLHFTESVRVLIQHYRLPESERKLHGHLLVRQEDFEYYRNHKFRTKHLHRKYLKGAKACSRSVRRKTGCSRYCKNSEVVNLGNEVRYVCRLAAKLRYRLLAKESKIHITKCWEYIAQVIDRIFLLTYMIAMIISSLLVFPNPEAVPDDHKEAQYL